MTVEELRHLLAGFPADCPICISLNDKVFDIIVFRMSCGDKQMAYLKPRMDVSIVDEVAETIEREPAYGEGVNFPL